MMTLPKAMIFLKPMLMAQLVLFSIVVSVPAVPQTQGVELLLSKARSLEARGRMDLASQNWHQALMADPNQTEALAGLARYAKKSGNAAEERTYLDRLKKINPTDPAIAQVERMKVITPQEKSRLEEAGRLTMQGKPDEAMRIYRDVLGDEPPPGEWAQPYYEAATASKTGRNAAIAHLRQLSAHDSKNEVYRFWLARALAYDLKTRMEAFRMLESIHDPGTAEQARATWRQALLWEKENPDVREPLEAYLQLYPDAQLQNILTALREKQEKEIVNADEKHGYDALHSNDVMAAQAKFEQALQSSPKDANALAGLGFVRLKQKRFDEALDLFDRARILAPQRKDVQQGYDDARFLGVMNRASVELTHGRPDTAAAEYQQALALRPSDPQALLGLAQTQMHQGQFHDAEISFQQVLTQSPNNVDAMAGIGLARMKQNDFAQALTWFGRVQKLVPDRADIREAYETAKYLGFMKDGTEALQKNRPAEAVSAYKQALSVRPGTKDTLLALARANETNKDYSGAAQAYTQLTNADPNGIQGWLGLIWDQLKSKDPKAALASMERIPPQAKTTIETRSDFLAEMALAYYETNQPEQGDVALRRALQAAARSDSEDAMNVRLQVASMLMDQAKTPVATEVYKQATELHPDEVNAWEGLVGVYVRARNFSAAESTLGAMPKSSYTDAAKNSGFLTAVASVYSAEGRCQEAEDFLNRASSLDEASGRLPALDIETQLADLWTREGDYRKAAKEYQEILKRDSNRSDIWRAYIATLHSSGQDQLASSEMKRVPAGIASEMEKDSRFLSLLANIEVAQGNTTEAVQWLERARSSYQAQGETPPADLIVQLAWLRFSTGDTTPGFAELLSQADARKDLTVKQRRAIRSIRATWSVRQADRALANHKPKESESILLAASKTLPGDTQIRAALCTLYMQRHDYAKALNIYLASSMADAEASDYRAAAGAALAAHKTELADQFLRQGLNRFPNDAELLHMAGKREASEGKYNEATRDLKLALSAMHSRDSGDNSSSLGRSSAAANPDLTANDSLAAHPENNLTASGTFGSGCRSSSNTNQANNAGIKPIAMVWRESVDPGTREKDSTGDNGKENPITPIEIVRTQDEIDIIENRNTPFVSADDTGGGRTGDAGFNRLIVEDGSMGSSTAINNTVRLQIAAHGVYLSSGTPSGGSTFQLGTLPKGTIFGSQSALGYSGEVQLSTNDFGLMFGNSPQGFPVHSLVGGIRFRPGHGPLTLLFIRDNVKDSLLSYAGVRDPGTGITWGGVMSNSGSLQLRRDSRWNGQYFTVRYSDIRGKNVADNTSVDGIVGAYFNVLQKPQAGVTIGIDAGGMHYDKNLQFFTLGQGGYFSPQQYYRATIPITVSGQHNRLQYQLAVAGGAQHFTQDGSLFYPIGLGLTLPPQSFYSGGVQTDPSYSATFRMNYRVTDHTNFGLFATANNARNYATEAVGFSLKFLIHRVPTNPELQVHSIPDWKGNPPFDLGLNR